MTLPIEPNNAAPDNAAQRHPSGYEAERGTVYVWKDGRRQFLANFDARIVSEEIHDDGSGTTTRFLVIGGITSSGDRLPESRLSASEFGSLDWVVPLFGAGAVVAAGYGKRDQLREAIQALSTERETTRVFAHTGWRELDGEWTYLHGGGAITARGENSAAVVLPGRLSNFVLPRPPEAEALLDAIHASLRILDVGPDTSTFPLYAQMTRTVLGNTDFGGFLVGRTGSGKSEFAALIQRHFGSAMDAEHLPGSWSSTANSLEWSAFVLKDAVMVVDDFLPQTSAYATKQLSREVDRLYRAQANQAGRGRMTAGGGLAQERFPRGSVLSTGEDLPPGESLRARILICELGNSGPDGIEWNVLTECQKDAAAGKYAAAMAGYLRWLAPRFADLTTELPARVSAARQTLLGGGSHRKTPTMMANLTVGFDTFLQFAEETEAISATQRASLNARLSAALVAVGSQAGLTAEFDDPAGRFFALLRGALISGRVHVASMSRGCPSSQPEGGRAWGWATQDYEARPNGLCIGFIDGESLYLEPEAALAGATAQARGQGEEFPISPRTLWKRLFEGGHIIDREAGRQRFTVRRVVGKTRLEVLYVRADSVLQHDADAPDPHEDDGRWRELIGTMDDWKERQEAKLAKAGLRELARSSLDAAPKPGTPFSESAQTVEAHEREPITF